MTNTYQPFSRARPAFLNVAEDISVVSCKLIVGDILSSPPSCVSYKRNRVDCFYVNAETQTVYQKTILSGEAQKSVDTVGKVRDEVVAVGVSSRKFMLVALNQSNHLVARMARNDGWSDWMPVANAVALEVPSTFMRHSGRVTCFYRDLHNTLWSVESSRYGGWDTPRHLHMGSMSSAPTCLEREDGDADACFVLDADNQIKSQQWIFGGVGNSEKALGGTGKNRISVTSVDSDRLDVFVLGKNNQLMHRVLIEDKWEDWEDLGGNFISSPECLAMGEESLHCFLIGADRALMHKSFNGDSWSEWVSSAQSLIEKPSCVVVNRATIACYSRGYTGHMVEIIYKV